MCVVGFVCALFACLARNSCREGKNKHCKGEEEEKKKELLLLVKPMFFRYFLHFTLFFFFGLFSGEEVEREALLSLLLFPPFLFFCLGLMLVTGFVASPLLFLCVADFESFLGKERV